MRTFFNRMLFVLLAACAPAALAADEAASRSAAVSFVAKAVEHLKRQGKDMAMQDFNDPRGSFVQGELYIVVLDMDGVLLADGRNPKLVNKPMADLRDVNGKYFVREELKLARESGKGWVDFQWLNPVTRNMETRSSYFERIGDVIVVTGVYRR